jgi:hypothetical protein
MRDLVGKRLAVYDELHRSGTVAATRDADAVAWLLTHRLIEQTDWAISPVGIATARERFERLGPLNVPKAERRAKEALPAPPPRPPVQPHQAEFFALEGYTQ